MKIWRVVLVMLLCTLLPWRGAMAIAMPCGAPVTTTQATIHTPAPAADAVDAVDAGAPHDTSAHAALPAALHDACEAMADMGVDGESSHTPGDACSACAACTVFCHAAVLPHGATVLAGLLAPAATIFPALVTPTPLFVVEGPERPPRPV